MVVGTAFLRAEMAEVVAGQMLQHTEQPRAQLAETLLGHLDGLFGEEPMKKGLREILRVVCGMTTAAKERVDGIPVARA